jgi:hypothetical protein
MFIRFRQTTAQRYGRRFSAGPDERECAGKCKDRPRYYPRYGVGMVVKGRSLLRGCPMKPLCPLKQKRHRLEVSIVETHREGRKVRQKHIASLGSIDADQYLQDREAFWLECEDRLARLSNRLGPDLDRLRQAIAARIPPLTDADRATIEAAAWDRLEAQWDGHAKKTARESSEWNETAKWYRREATEAEVATLQVKRLRGKPQAYEPLNMLLGLRLRGAAMGGRADHEKIAQQLKDEVSEHDS